MPALAYQMLTGITFAEFTVLREHANNLTFANKDQKQGKDSSKNVQHLKTGNAAAG